MKLNANRKNNKSDKRNRGSVTVFLSIILAPMLLLSVLAADGARLSAQTTALSNAGDLALNAALASYDSNLYGNFGIFAVSADDAEIHQQVKGCFDESLNATLSSVGSAYQNAAVQSLFGGKYLINLCGSTATDFSLQGIPSSAAADPVAIEAQMYEAVKYTAPLTSADGHTDRILTLKNVSAELADLIDEIRQDAATGCADAYEVTSTEQYFTQWVMRLFNIYAAKGANTTLKTKTAVPAELKAAIGLNIASKINTYYDLASETDLTYTAAAPVENGSIQNNLAIGLNNLIAAQQLFASVSGIGELNENDLFTAEYLTDMFSCYTDTLTASPLASNGAALNKRLCFGNEAEYLCIGNSNMQNSLSSSVQLIFGFRFALNALSAFNSPSLRSAATVYAGNLTGYGKDTAAVADSILLSWAMSESLTDVEYICNGKSVPMYKSESTRSWQAEECYNAYNEGHNVVIYPGAFEDAFSLIENTDRDNNFIATAQKGIKQYADLMLDTLCDDISGRINAALCDCAVEILCSGSAQTIDTISASATRALSALQPTGSDFADTLMQTALSALNSNKTAPVKQFYQIYQAKIAGATAGEISNMLYGRACDSGFLFDIQKQIRDAMQSTVYAKEKELYSFCNQMMRRITETKIEDGIETKTAVDMKNMAVFTVNQIAGVVKGTVAAGGFAMDYSDYLEMITLLAMAGGEKETLLHRAVNLMQADTAAKNPGFDITQAYTLVQAGATTQVKTLTTFSKGSNGLKLTAGTNKYQKLNYVSVGGY